jgi:hypothetical protein
MLTATCRSIEDQFCEELRNATTEQQAWTCYLALQELMELGKNLQIIYLQKRRRWMQLPTAMMGLICEHLSLDEQIRLTEVSKTWKALLPWQTRVLIPLKYPTTIPLPIESYSDLAITGKAALFFPTV